MLFADNLFRTYDKDDRNNQQHTSHNTHSFDTLGLPSYQVSMQEKKDKVSAQEL